MEDCYSVLQRRDTNDYYLVKNGNVDNAIPVIKNIDEFGNVNFTFVNGGNLINVNGILININKLLNETRSRIGAGNFYQQKVTANTGEKANNARDPVMANIEETGSAPNLPQFTADQPSVAEGNVFRTTVVQRNYNNKVGVANSNSDDYSWGPWNDPDTLNIQLIPNEYDGTYIRPLGKFITTAIVGAGAAPNQYAVPRFVDKNVFRDTDIYNLKDLTFGSEFSNLQKGSDATTSSPVTLDDPPACIARNCNHNDQPREPRVILNRLIDAAATGRRLWYPNYNVSTAIFYQVS